MKQRGPYGYLCEIANPPFKFFVENATDEDGHPLLSEKDLGNGMKVFPIWREERPEVLPPTIGYVRHDFENDEIYFITNRDFESVILENREEWEQVTARYAIEWNACDQHIKVAEFHEKAHEAFSTWKYLPRDVPKDIRDGLRAIYDDKAKVAFAESYRLGFRNEPVPEEKLETAHREMADRHRQLARIYSY
jgi:hypothetical protein